MNILLHICCANCAAYPVKTLHEEKHDLTGFWFNPNIQPNDEYALRLGSVKKLAGLWSLDMLYNEYEPEKFITLFPEYVPQGPERCRLCYSLRLEKTAVEASGRGFDAFSTTLLISPYQDFEQICAMGNELAGKYDISFFLKDFRSYFRESMATAKELGMYRQKYCGCIFSRDKRYQKKIKTVKS